jgi:hypothetical protein
MDHRHTHTRSRKKLKQKSSASTDKYRSSKIQSSSSKKSTREHRLISDRRENYPDGYVEDCSVYCPSATSNNSSTKSVPDFELSVAETQPPIPTPFRYSPTSVILSTTSNLILNQTSSYDIHFSTGIAEGNGITINDTGNVITFLEEGSYRFEVYGEAAPFSDVNVKLVFFSDKFTEDLKPFTETNIPKDEGKLLLRGIATILPLHKNQMVNVRLIPDPDESIALLSNTRLLIHRVA